MRRGLLLSLAATVPLGLALLAIVPLGCATLVPLLPHAFSPCRPQPEVSADSLGPDFRYRAQASFREDGSERAALEIVVEKHGDRAALVAFDRTGLRVVSAVLQGTALTEEIVPGRRRPLPPDALFADVRRIRIPEAVEPDVRVTRDDSDPTRPRSTLVDARCGTESVYVTLEDRPLPSPSSDGGK